MNRRKETRSISVGSVKIGGSAPVVVQSMTCTDTRDIQSTISQIHRLEEAGCEIVRVAVPDVEAAAAVGKIKKAINLPLIADIHFNEKLAHGALEGGADGIRINPGNMPRESVRRIIQDARGRAAALRIGVNSGSLEQDLLDRFGHPCAEALVESALRHISLCEELDFHNLKLSLKSSHVPTMIDAYRLISAKADYPLHLGVTEAGSLLSAAIKSSIGIGILLSEGIGDTIRVSVAGDPVSEMPVAFGILRALGIRKVGPDIIACPTCGRCEIDLAGLVDKVERRLAGMKEHLVIALMGCVVNGPGEAAEADIGIAGGRGKGILFKKGTVMRTVPEDQFFDVLVEEIGQMIGRKV
ncbi:MAG: flavodoxin-dependent (E)-4-hydroxy-3-methylbut-2-enyl-diphosphate synthase [Deltaproteobacteria bacterium]|nr:flavodoxin-dependent (E)-4-hydroxy-3-methylbut-2-enyl-diphosphate synthase [Deltaproteobacteria bacterium]